MARPKGSKSTRVTRVVVLCENCRLSFTHESRSGKPTRFCSAKCRLRKQYLKRKADPVAYAEWLRRGRDAKRKARSRGTAKLKCGVSIQEKGRLLTNQDGLCGICKTAASPTTWHVDHCHATGKVRSVLCFHCNTGLGMFKDNPELLRLAAWYLECHRG